MKHDCDVVRDLMPMCIDGTASEKSVAVVEAHITDCPPCDAIYKEMRGEPELPPAVPDPAFTQTVRRMQKNRRTRALRALLLGVLIAVVVFAAGSAGYWWYFQDEVLVAPSAIILSATADGLGVIAVDGVPVGTEMEIELKEIVYPEGGQRGHYEAYVWLYATRSACNGGDTGYDFVVAGVQNDGVIIRQGNAARNVRRIVAGREDGGGTVIFLADDTEIPEISLQGAHIKSPRRVRGEPSPDDGSWQNIVTLQPTATPMYIVTWIEEISPTPRVTVGPATDGDIPRVTTTPIPSPTVSPWTEQTIVVTPTLTPAPPPDADS